VADRRSITLFADFRKALGHLAYPTYFHHVQAPAHLNYICALNGLSGPNLNNAFTYCEIGCGTGLTTYVLAAANPDGYFVGIDLSPTHVTQATQRATAGGLANLRYLAKDIVDLESSKLPEFDFITLHGLYSWVDAKTRAAIRRFIDARLRPGGVIYLSYNAMPGWSSAALIRRFFEEKFPRVDGDPIVRTAAILNMLADFENKGAPLFTDNESVRSYFAGLRNRDLRYLAHEFLAPAFDPMYFADVCSDMEQIGLRYVGDGDVLQNLPRHSSLPSFIETLAGIPERSEREAFKDFVHNRFFRRDVYIRPTPADPAPESCPINQVLFGLSAPAFALSREVHVLGTKLQIAGAWFECLKELLAFRVLTLPEILQEAAFSDTSPEQLLEDLKLLTIGGVLVPCARRSIEMSSDRPKSLRVTPKANEVLLRPDGQQDAGFTLASPVTGSGIEITDLEALLLRCLELDCDVWEVLAEFGQRSNRDFSWRPGKTLKKEQERSTWVHTFVAETLPKLVSLGLVELEAG
jgi:SAM-dependent methyltransferase